MQFYNLFVSFGEIIEDIPRPNNALNVYIGEEMQRRRIMLSQVQYVRVLVGVFFEMSADNIDEMAREERVLHGAVGHVCVDFDDDEGSYTSVHECTEPYMSVHECT